MLSGSRLATSDDVLSREVQADGRRAFQLHAHDRWSPTQLMCYEGVWVPMEVKW